MRSLAKKKKKKAPKTKAKNFQAKPNRIFSIHFESDC